MGYKRPKNIMKKLSFLFLVVLAISVTSCKGTAVSATYQDPSSYINTATVADLEVSNERISYTFQPSKEVIRGGNQNIIKAAIREALRANGGGDVLVDLEYIIVYSPFFWSRVIDEVTVSGYPAKYTNFRSLGDSIWAPTKLYPENIYINKTSLQSVNQSINSQRR